MLSYMLPVEEKSPSVTAASAAAAARNLSLNLNNTTPKSSSTSAGGGGSVPASNGGQAGTGIRPEVSSKSAVLFASQQLSSRSQSQGTTSGKVIKSAIKTNHRYHLVGGGGTVGGNGLTAEENGGGGGVSRKRFGKRIGDSAAAAVGRPNRNGSSSGVEDLSDEHTSLLGGGGGGGGVGGGGNSKSVKSDKNFNNLILDNGNGNVSVKLASVLKNTSQKNGTVVCGLGGNSGALNGSTGGVGDQYGGPLKVAISSSHNGYSAVNNCDEDEEEDGSAHEGFDLVAANNRKNTQQQQQQQQKQLQQTINGGKMSASASVTRNLNGINGNQQQQQQQTGPQQQSSVETPSSGIIVDTSDADSEQTATSNGGGAGTDGSGAGGKKVKMNKLGGSKNVTLKRVSFGSSKGSMVETLVFETPTPLPEHAEREFFHSPAVLAGAGTTVNSVHHHYHHLPHYHHPQQQHQQQDSSQVGLDDSGIELQEEVERSKVRVSFFQSSKPQSISPPESLLFGGHNLIHFGGPGSGSGGGYDNNNSLLDSSSYITSAALNQQYDLLLAGHHPYSDHPAYNPDDPASMAAVMAYDRQMSTESGWDNPFRPGGDLSREADEIVNLIKGGKPITPTGDQSLLNGSAPKDNSSDYPTENGGSTVVDGVATKLESTQLQSSQQQPNGTKSSPQKGGAGDKNTGATAAQTATSPQKNGATGQQQQQQTQVSNQVIPGPQSASHVVIDEKKKKKCACCVIQ
ncbi:uncharacterized protein LOC129718848 [Wyeomyia smithii]|uniref:uncharacterized protein LOC129718848 n=1 Tax=Wyeomyia smithii TaxID=174621 RepID=UPI002467C6C0|nr:uncharacterized protein LOC129718848 [Wyeomyia smithii]